MSNPKHGTCAEPSRTRSVPLAPPARLRRHIAGCLAFLLAVPFGGAATAGLQQAVPGQRQGGAGTLATGSPQPPAVGDGANPAGSQSSAQNPQSNATQSAPEQQQQTPNPVGTAAAPYEKTTGIAASRPAGAVIAPAKQKRKRSFLIRVGLILGGAAAIGAVIALSNASPSRP